MIRRASLTLRLALLFAAVNALLVALLGVAVHQASDRHFVEQDLHDLHGRAMQISRRIELAGPAGDLSDLGDLLVGHHALAVSITAPDGTARFTREAAVIEAMPSPAGATTTFAHGGNRWRGIEMPLPVPASGRAPQMSLRIAMSIEHHDDFLAMLDRALTVAGLAVTVAGFALGWLVARRGLAPLATMARHTADISASRLDERLDADRLPAEVQPLARELNAMLGRLEDAFGRLAGFSSDIAHELRTPVSNLMTATQVALARPRDAAGYRETLESNLEEFERLARMVNDMLFIAKADHGLAVPNREHVDLAAEADATIEFHEAIAADRGIRVLRTGAAGVSGDRLMIRRALSNLLSNALRHAAAGTTVTVELAQDGATASFSVANVGDPIPPEILPRLFDRFYRADPSRAGSAEGAGLGLAIVRSIAAAHGGTAGVRRVAGCNRFTVVLPTFADASGATLPQHPHAPPAAIRPLA